MHIDKHIRNFIVSGLVVVSVFAVWLFFAKIPDAIRSFDKKQANITQEIKNMPFSQAQLPAQQKPMLYQIRVGTVDMFVEVAETQQEKAKGLSARNNLPQNQGLLFLFDAPAPYQFWMKDMKFPIDILWIGPDQKIVDITEHADPASYPKTFSPQTPAQYVLETNVFFAKTYGLRVGDSVDISKVLK
jgi:uncharacterized membrane protein (UPF0127 family)